MTTTLRKKTDKASATASAGVGGGPQTTSSGDQELTDQLDRAYTAVERNHVAMRTLHQQWRTQLLRMAYLVMIVTLHIAQAPSSTCIQDIKQFNRENPDVAVPGTRAIGIILYDSVVEILSILCAVFIVGCLRRVPGHSGGGDDFSSFPYRLSCVVLPMIISLHFHKKTTVTSTTTTTATSCVVESILFHHGNDDHNNKNHAALEFQSQQPTVTRHFPVILIFHTVVSLSLWFMQYQNQQHVKNLELVQKLQHDLTEAKTTRRVEKKKR